MSDDEVAATSDHAIGIDPDDAPNCATCGDPVLGETHRVITRVADDAVIHRHFCDETCLGTWDDERE